MANAARKSLQSSRYINEVCGHLLKKETERKKREKEDCTAVKQEVSEGGEICQ
jgi:hypothetical protein